MFKTGIIDKPWPQCNRCYHRRFGNARICPSSEWNAIFRWVSVERRAVPPAPEIRVCATKATVIPVVAAVVSRGGDYLVCRRPQSKAHGGCWEFPGGKVAPGEADRDALKRELREELDVAVVRIGACRFKVREPATPYRIAFYDAVISGQPRVLEHSGIDWLSPDQLNNVTLAPADRRFVEECLLRRPEMASHFGKDF